MRAIISVDIKVRKAELAECKTDLLCLGMFSDGKGLDKVTGKLDKKLGGAISKLVKLGDFEGKDESSAVVYSDGKISARRVLLIGLGEKKDITLDKIRQAAALGAAKAVTLKSKSLALALHQNTGRGDVEKVGQAVAEGVYFGSYRYDEFVTNDENGRLKNISVEVIDSQAAKLSKLSKGVSVGKVIGQGQAFARTLANRPGNVVNPAVLAAEAEKMAKGVAGLSCTVFDDKQLKAKKMGGILAVGSGSKNKPRLIVLKYTPGKKGKVSTIGLVGKAITFDSGGLSIKPANGMQDMKFDKSGGIAVLATMKVIATLKPAVVVYGIIPAAENMPGGESYRPGDIVTTYSGKTVEVQNTDAEGRMILCDAIHYAVTQKCDVIVDIATLTASCMVALGKYMAGLMSNNDELIKQLQAASKNSGEKIWHMPSGNEYTKEMKSKIADLKNIGSKWGGACTAASFLAEFAGDTKWAHIDMAGVDMFDAAEKRGSVGATGFGVRLLTDYVMNAARKKLKT